MKINVTYYAEGQVDRNSRPREQGYQSIEIALDDMFRRLMTGAEVAYSGFCMTLKNYFYIGSTDEDEPTGLTEAIYGGANSVLQDFLIAATKWARNKPKELGTPEHEHFIRCALLEKATILSDQEMEVAQNMDRSEFISAMSMAIEDGDDVAVLFQPDTAIT